MNQVNTDQNNRDLGLVLMFRQGLGLGVELGLRLELGLGLELELGIDLESGWSKGKSQV